MKKNLLLSLLLVLLPVAAGAYDAKVGDIYYTFLGDEAHVTYGYSMSGTYSGDVTIPKSVSYDGKTYTVTSIGNFAFENCSELTSVSLPATLKSIGDFAFENCSGLTSISIPSSVTSFGHYAFSGCSSLASVGIPDGVEMMENGLFQECTSLTTISIPNGVKSIGQSVFYNCTGLTNITFGSGLESIGDFAFSGCSSLAAIAVPNSVTSIGSSAFSRTAWLDNQPDGVVYAGKVAYSYKGNMPTGTEITIEKGTQSITTGAFYGFNGLTSVVVQDGLKVIGANAFRNCSNLASITIPESVNYIGLQAFDGTTWYDSQSSGLIYLGKIAYKYKGYMPDGAQIEIKDGTLSIAAEAFARFSELASITIPNSVTSIGEKAFYDCSELTSVTIPNSVTSIGAYAFQFCKKLASPISIPEGVTNIENGVFSYCSSLTSVTIPASVKSIGEKAFEECSGLTSFVIPEGVERLSTGAFMDCSGLTSITIPGSVTVMLGEVFKKCRSLTSIDIPEGTRSIGSYSFQDCTGLMSISIPNSVNDIGTGIFKGCYIMETAFVNNSRFPTGSWGITFIDEETDDGLLIKDNHIVKCRDWVTSVTIPESVIGIYDGAFNTCTNLTKVIVPNLAAWCGIKFSSGSSNPLYFAQHLFSDENTEVTNLVIPEGITNISNFAFYGCTGLTSVTIPNRVTKVGNSTFYGCENVTTLNLDVENIDSWFSNNSKLNTITLGDNVKRINNSAFSGCSSLLRVNFGLGLTYIDPSAFQNISYSSKFYVKDKTITLLTLWNGGYDSKIYNIETEEKIEPFTPVFNITASSLRFVEGLTGIRRAIKQSEKLYLNDKEIDAEGQAFLGLDPETEVSVKYAASFQYFNETVSFEKTSTIKTAELSLTTLQPKVISEGNVIVAAQSNLDDEEINVGFEWRRTDWTDDFDSKNGGAYLYEGAMEGYIRSLNHNYLWKFRPYYISEAGNAYYGDWKGMDPSDYSWFEPTVHTYTTINVQGNSAEIKGYAMRGTDNVTSQGFMYWKDTSSYSLRRKAASIPSDAVTIQANGNVMTAKLQDLEYETTYCYVAFVTTSEGETFFGEVQTFSTNVDPDGIDDVKASEESVEIARYDLQGHRISKPQKGINIIRYSDGTSRKVLIK